MSSHSSSEKITCNLGTIQQMTVFHDNIFESVLVGVKGVMKKIEGGGESAKQGIYQDIVWLHRRSIRRKGSRTK
jgi:hypothetical protein